jgi:hypothetical protein
MFVLTLQGPTADGNHLLESWEISREVYLHMRAHMDREPMATTLTDGKAKVISQRFIDDEEAIG